MEPCCGSRPGLRHRLCHSDAVNVEIESVSRDHSVDDDDGRNLPTALAGMGLLQDGTETFVLDALHYSPSPNNAKSSFSVEESLLRMLRGVPPTTTTTITSSLHSKAGPEYGKCVQFYCDGKRPDHLPHRSHVSHMLSPVLKFVTSSDVFQSLKRVEIHAGLSSTQLFDLCWVLDNLFNVHGGVQILFTLTSKGRIIMIIKYCRF